MNTADYLRFWLSIVALACCSAAVGMSVVALRLARKTKRMREEEQEGKRK